MAPNEVDRNQLGNKCGGIPAQRSKGELNMTVVDHHEHSDDKVSIDIRCGEVNKQD